MAAALRRRVRRRLRTPFTAAAGDAVLVHCAHHKVGTVWFQRVLATLCTAYGLRFEEVPDTTDHGGTAVAAGRPGSGDVALYDRANDFDPDAYPGRSVAR